MTPICNDILLGVDSVNLQHDLLRLLRDEQFQILSCEFVSRKLFVLQLFLPLDDIVDGRVPFLDFCWLLSSGGWSREGLLVGHIAIAFWNATYRCKRTACIKPLPRCWSSR